MGQPEERLILKNITEEYCTYTENLMSSEQISQSGFSGQHAVVIGASMAGLLASRVLSEHFKQVTVIERDRLPQEVQPRKGVPQGRHVHVLLRSEERRVGKG